MQREQAEVLALRVLGWMAAEEGLLDAFLAETGIDRGHLGGLARQPTFLAAVLDFCLQADQRVLDCAASLEVPPMTLPQARQALPGGQDPHWT